MSKAIFDAWTPNWYAAASEEDQRAFREWFQGILRNERVNVCFTKVDGTERWLHCTLHPELIPIVENKDTPQRKSSDSAQSVWDIDAEGWRSFRWESIKEFSFNLGDLHV
jgi:hypothetical protein